MHLCPVEVAALVAAIPALGFAVTKIRALAKRLTRRFAS